MMRHTLTGLAVLLLGACTWVDLTPEGRNVMLAGPGDVSNCERIGRATARSLDEVVRVDRSAERLQGELLTLARNEAGAMGGNIIVPESVIQDGAQVFGIYRCP